MRSKAFAPYGGREIPIALPARRAPPPNKRPLPTPQRSRRTPPKLADHANNRATIRPSPPANGKRRHAEFVARADSISQKRALERFPFDIPVGARHEHSKARLQSALHRPAREPLGAHREGFGGEPKLLRGSPRLHRQRRRQGCPLSSRRRRGLSSQSRSQTRARRAAGRARGHAR